MLELSRTYRDKPPFYHAEEMLHQAAKDFGHLIDPNEPPNIDDRRFRHDGDFLAAFLWSPDGDFTGYARTKHFDEWDSRLPSSAGVVPLGRAQGVDFHGEIKFSVCWVGGDGRPLSERDFYEHRELCMRYGDGRAHRMYGGGMYTVWRFHTYQDQAAWAAFTRMPNE